MKIFLVRHGETTGDIENRYGGSYDDHLTERGRVQLSTTAKSLKDKGIEIIFYSPLIRATESAKIIQNIIGSELEQVVGLQERHYGVLSGLTKEEALKKYPDAVIAHGDPHNTDPEGESFEDFNKRVISVFEWIKLEPYKTIAIVAHGGSIKRILTYLNAPIPKSIGDGEVIESDV